MNLNLSVPTPQNVEKERKRLIRRVRDAYRRMEMWERIHRSRSESLAAFMFRFPPPAKEKRARTKSAHAPVTG